MDRRTFLQLSASAVSAASLPAVSHAFDGAAGSPAVVRTWLNDQPTRIVWFTLPASNAALDPQAVVDASHAMDIDVIVFTAGGSTAFYPTALPFHDRSPFLKEGTDFFDGVTRAARAKGMRVGARFDFSKQSKATLEAHPEWFYRHADGSPAIDTTGRYMPCINSDFYHVHAVAVIDEAMERFDPVLLFLNSFGNFQIGFGNNEPCKCENCQKAHMAATGKPVPAEDNSEYQVFLRNSMRKSASLIYTAAHKRNPAIVVINADTDPVDGYHSEDRVPAFPAPMWLHQASEAVNRQRNSYPDKTHVNIVVGYSGNFSRLMVMPAEEIRVNCFQAIAHGAPLAYVFTGTPANQPDQRDLQAAKDIFSFHKKHEDLYGKRENLGEVLLLCEPETAPRHRTTLPEYTNRGIYRILSEGHIPVVVSESADILERKGKQFSLVVVTPGAPTKGLEEYVRRGGSVLFVNRPATFGLGESTGVHSASATGYAEIRDNAAFPSLRGIRYVSVSGGYAAVSDAGNIERETGAFYLYPNDGAAKLTFVKPMVENPVEFFQDPTRTDIPALLVRGLGKGTVACLPWDIGGLYTRQAYPVHRELLLDVLDRLLTGGRQIRSDAHNSVEMVLSGGSTAGKAVLHLINLSGQSQTGFMPPVRMENFKVAVRGRFTRVTTRASAATLPATFADGYTTFLVPALDAYEAVVLA